MNKRYSYKIINKLERMEKYQLYLEDIKKSSAKAFLADYHLHGLAERYLQLCIEIMIDVAKVILSEQKLPKPEDNQDTFRLLRENKILSKSLHEKLEGIAGFRNILVHDYEKIDRNMVYDYLKNNLGIFNKYRREIIKYIDK